MSINYINYFSYVTLGRLRNENGLYITDFNPASIYAAQQCINEYNRLRKSANMPLLGPANVQPPIASIFKQRPRKYKTNIPKNSVLFIFKFILKIIDI